MPIENILLQGRLKGEYLDEFIAGLKQLADRPVPKKSPHKSTKEFHNTAAAFLTEMQVFLTS